jgi:hypothetical protein
MRWEISEIKQANSKHLPIRDSLYTHYIILVLPRWINIKMCVVSFRQNSFGDQLFKHTTMNIYRRFLTSALEGGEWSGSRLGSFTFRKKPGYPLDRRLGGPQIRSEPRFLCHPARCPQLYRRSYHGSIMSVTGLFLSFRHTNIWLIF